MKISDIKIDGFGVWHDLLLRGLSPELTVLYGPNEAGKTTLMQFLRSVLYGVSPARRERYLPPLAGGRPGGWLRVIGDDGPLTIARHADRGPTDVGKVTITTADGQEQGDRLLREALENVDEPTFNNIFAVGLREVQELGTLSDTAAAQWLYRLTSGLDRISLYDVIHMLAGTRLRLLNTADQPSEIRALAAQREQLHAELDELVAQGRRWTQAAVKLQELAEEIDRQQAAAKEIAARARRLEVAIGVKPLWLKRDKLDGQLEHFCHLRPLEDGTLAALDDLNRRTEEHERQRDILKGQRQQLRDEARRLGINEQLVRSGQRLEALLEQQEWLQSLERQVEELGEEVSQLEGRLTSENERLSQEWTGAGKIPPRITSELVEQLSPQARAIEATEQLLQAAKHELEQRRVGEHQFRTQIESAMTGGEKFGLPTDIDQVGDLVAGLRRRQQVEQRIDAARRQADDLQEQGTHMVDEQVVPMGLFLWLLAAFVTGALAVAVWWFVPESTLGIYARYGGWIAAIGMGGSIFAWLFKYFVEDSAADRFDACHQQLELVLGQIKEAEAERKRLNAELPLADGSAALRLEQAERHLAEMERMLPVESQRREAAQEILAAERRLQLAEEKLAAALANWRSKLRALGLPDDVGPANLATMAGQCERLAELEAKIANRRDDAVRRHRELDALIQRIVALAEESGLRRKDAAPLRQLDELTSEYRRQQERVARRTELRERAKGLKAEEARHARAVAGYRRRRGALFQKCGVADENELRQLASRLEEAARLRQKREAATREIVAALGRHGTEMDFALLFAPEGIGRLEPDFAALSAELEKQDRELKELLQLRGALVEQQRAAAADRSLAKKRVELDMVEERIKQAIAAWRERAAVSLLLERVREDYERNRQPETLREASGYFRQLTGDKYTRIWTPLAHDILLVDTADGQSLPVQVLSRGTREQLFVSLRLALVSAFARRGIQVPLILDDVFVNFDAQRTRIAANVVREFARQGHQVLVFTCHEHVWRMFQEIKVDTRRLPSRYGAAAEDEQPAPVAGPELADAGPAPPPPDLPSSEPIAETPQQPVAPLNNVAEYEPIEPDEPAEFIVPEAEETKEDEVEYEFGRSASPGPQSEVEYWWPTSVG
jgi:uncharacterized protein YhaN